MNRHALFFALSAFTLLACGTDDDAGSGRRSAPDAALGTDAAPAGGPDAGGDSGAAARDDARIIEILFPAELGCGVNFEASVTVENTGSTDWTRGGGYKLGAVGDEDPLLNNGDVRVWLADDVSIAPGEQHTFTIPLLGPDEAMSAMSDWQMVREGVRWFGETPDAEVNVDCEGSGGPFPLPLPDMSSVVDEVARERPDLLAGSCLADGGSWGFLDMVVDRLRATDTRWGYNWKRGVVGDASQDVVDYHYGPGAPEGSTDVYIIDIIVGHCGDSPDPGWLDQTEATAAAGTIGRWTGRGRF